MSPPNSLFDPREDDSCDDPEEKHDLDGFSIIETVDPGGMPWWDGEKDDPVPDNDLDDLEVEVLMDAATKRGKAYNKPWNAAETKMVSGPCTAEAAIKGTPGPLMSRKESFEYCLKKYGRVYESFNTPHRWIHRVPKEPLK